MLTDSVNMEHMKNANDTKRIKKKQVTLILYSFTPSDMNFQTILMPKVILAKFLSQKIYSLGPFLSFLYLSCILEILICLI